MKFSDLIVWQKSIILAKDIYQKTKKFPKEEQFSLGDQIRRAAVSIFSNIAEGHCRGSTKAYVNHLNISTASLKELESQIRFATVIEYLSENDSIKLISQMDEIGRMLNALIKSLQKHL